MSFSGGSCCREIRSYPLRAHGVLLLSPRMKTSVLKVSRIGNSRGIRLPAAMLRKYHITDTVIAEELTDEIVLRAGRNKPQKLSWEESTQMRNAMSCSLPI